MIKKIHVENYRIFQSLTLDLCEGLNILVGNNDAGKSTLLEAVHLGLTGRLGGRLLDSELSPYLFNQTTTNQYARDVRDGKNPPPPMPSLSSTSRRRKRLSN